MSTQKIYSDLRKINLAEHLEKKGNLTYLSWAWAVDTLMQQDPLATWEFKEPTWFGETCMVHCTVSALGKTIPMHLPVMDNKNKSIVNPNSRDVSDAMMRCLTKSIACLGIGLYVYAGEDLPPEQDPPPPNTRAIAEAPLTRAIAATKKHTDPVPHVSYENFAGTQSAIAAVIAPVAKLSDPKNPRVDEIVAAAKAHQWSNEEVKNYMANIYKKNRAADLTPEETQKLIKNITLFSYQELTEPSKD